MCIYIYIYIYAYIYLSLSIYIYICIYIYIYVCICVYVSLQIGRTQRGLAWSLRRDDAHEPRSVNSFEAPEWRRHPVLDVAPPTVTLRCGL